MGGAFFLLYAHLAGAGFVLVYTWLQNHLKAHVSYWHLIQIQFLWSFFDGHGPPGSSIMTCFIDHAFSYICNPAALLILPI